MIFWFSGTGNSEWVARMIAKMLPDDRLVNMAEAVCQGDFSYHLAEGETLGFCFPTHAWNLPLVVDDFFSHLQLTGGEQAYTYYICTCGDDCGRQHHRLKLTLQRHGLHLDMGMEIPMPNTYVCLPGFDTDSDDLMREKCRKATERVAFSVQLIRERRTDEYHLIRSSWARTKTYLLGKAFRRWLMNPQDFHTTDACNGCGLCMKSCPLHNITLLPGERRPQWKNHCTLCLSCYHRCPQQAIRFGKYTEKKGQYHRKDFLADP